MWRSFCPEMPSFFPIRTLLSLALTGRREKATLWHLGSVTLAYRDAHVRYIATCDSTATLSPRTDTYELPVTHIAVKVSMHCYLLSSSTHPLPFWFYMGQAKDVQGVVGLNIAPQLSHAFHFAQFCALLISAPSSIAPTAFHL